MLNTCPKCHGSLQLTTSAGVPVSVCQRCRGLWLSTSALVHQTSSRLYHDLRAQPRTAAVEQEHPFRSAAPITCVACNRPMQVKQLGPIEAEHCPECDAVFLDRGELVALVMAFREHAVRYGSQATAGEKLVEILNGLVETV